MKSKYKKGSAGVGAVIVVIVLLAGIFYFKGSKNDAEMMQEEGVLMEQKTETQDESNMMKEEVIDDSVAKNDSSMEVKTEMMIKKGSYEIYSPEKIALAENGKVVLFFNASWCPTCQGADKELKASVIPDGVTILSVDYDSSSELKKKYGVTYQHTFVQVDANGVMIKKWSGGGLANIVTQVK